MNREERLKYYYRVYDMLHRMSRNSKFVIDKEVHPDNRAFFQLCAADHIKWLNIATIREQGDRLWTIVEDSEQTTVRCDYADSHARAWHHKYMLNNIKIINYDSREDN